MHSSRLISIKEAILICASNRNCCVKLELYSHGQMCRNARHERKHTYVHIWFHAGHLHWISEVDLDGYTAATAARAAGPRCRHVSVVHELGDEVVLSVVTERCESIGCQDVAVLVRHVGHAGGAGVGRQGWRGHGVADTFGERPGVLQTTGVLRRDLPVNTSMTCV